MQGMMDNLSQPVAFATAPLGDAEPNSGSSTPPDRDLRRDPSFSSDTDSASDEPLFSRFSRRIGLGRDGKKPTRGSNLRTATPKTDEDFDEDFLDEGQSINLLATAVFSDTV